MKMKCFLLSCFCIHLFLIHANSQSSFGVKAGMQLAKMTGFEENPKGFLPTVQIKAIGIFPLSDELTINPSLGYSGKGFKWNDIEFTDQYGNFLGNGDVIGLFHYIQLTVPIAYKIAPDSKQEYYFGAGPYFGYAVSGKGKIKHAALANGEDSWDLFSDDAYKKTDAGIVIEISSTLKKKYMVAVNFDIGLSDVSNTGGGKLKQMTGGISIGYLFGKRS